MQGCAIYHLWKENPSKRIKTTFPLFSCLHSLFSLCLCSLIVWFSLKLETFSIKLGAISKLYRIFALGNGAFSLKVCDLSNDFVTLQTCLCRFVRFCANFQKASVCVCSVSHYSWLAQKEVHQIAIPHPLKQNRCECSPTDCTFGEHHKGVGAHIALPQFFGVIVGTSSSKSRLSSESYPPR